MERFCDKCGTLVSGDGPFCPSCGAPMDGAQNDVHSSGVDLTKGSMPSTSDPVIPTPSAGYQQPNYSQPNYLQPGYPQQNYGQQNYYQQPTYMQNNQEMTTGQWVLTIFLSGLGIIGLVLLFVWAFSGNTPVAKRNWARAMLIFELIAVVLVVVLFFAFGAVFRNIFDDWYYEFKSYFSLIPTFWGK